MRDPRSTATLALRLGAGLLFASAAGCHGDASVFAPAGPAARSISRLGGAVIAALSTAALVMLVLIVIAAVRRSGSLEAHDPPNLGGGHRWVVVGGFLVPAVVLGVVFVATLVTVDRFPLHDGQHYRADVRIVGRQWWWEIQYLGRTPDQNVTTANEIHVPIGWPVEIELESRDVIHSFWVPALHGKVDLIPGQTNHIRVTADVPGRYEGQCAEYCGPQHTMMRFVVVAEPLEDYEAWLAHQAEPAARPTDAEAVAGAEIFETRACGVCHTVRGSRALSAVGPDLTHLASRKTLAAGSLPASRAYLEAWITHAQSLKPGSQMPDLTILTGPELHALSHYLEGLQ